MAQGVVKWFDAERGVGGITCDDGGAELAVRQAGIDGGGRQSLRASQRVAFIVEDGSAAGVYSP